jgi:hypothetical protein
MDWPVCRSHLRVWANANPWEVVKRREPIGVLLRTGARWAETRGLGPGPWVEMRVKSSPPDGAHTSDILVVVPPDEATVMADWYSENGFPGAAAMLLRHVLTTAAVRADAQGDLWARTTT